LQNYVPLVLALEPDLRQATILKRMIRDRVHAELVVVDSRDEAISAVDARLPDVILFTALLSPRDEAEIISHLRTLAGAEHVQTHTIPQLASATPDGEEEAPQGGLFGRLRRKKAEPIPGCDPLAFADEIGTFIARAADMKLMAAASPVSASAKAAAKASAPPPQQKRQSPAAGEFADDDAETADGAPAAESAWADPFAWRPSSSSRKSAEKDKQPKKPREPLVTTAPLAVVAEEEEQRLAKEFE
jgi:CheY-like chemotaxis protein